MYLSLCLIVKNENTYLKEWLDYHILIGVEHFWIYDNESDVPVSRTLADYIQSGWVTVNNIKGPAMQLFAYDHCVQTYGLHSKWIGFIDTDEFIVLREGKNLPEFLVPYEQYGGLAISSLFFGHGGNKKRPAAGQIAGYRFRTHERFSFNRLVKMIIQPEKVIYPVSPHSFIYKDRFFSVNENEWHVDAQSFPCHIKKIQVNHYFTRSEEEWNQKLSRGNAGSVVWNDNRGTLVNNYARVKDTLILERLADILPSTNKAPQAWKKLSAPDSTRFLDLLHREAAKKVSAPFDQEIPLEAVARPILIDFFERRNLGIKLFEEGKIAEARDLFAADINNFPFDVVNYTSFASASLKLKEFEAAWNALAQAWRLAPRSLYVLLGMTDYFYARGDFAQAEKTCLLAEEQGDLEPVSIALLALSQWRQGKKQEAAITAKPLLDHLPEDEAQKPIFKELITLIKQVS
jgi:hypothetical protein